MKQILVRQNSQTTLEILPFYPRSSVLANNVRVPIRRHQLWKTLQSRLDCNEPSSELFFSAQTLQPWAVWRTVSKTKRTFARAWFHAGFVDFEKISRKFCWEILSGFPRSRFGTFQNSRSSSTGKWSFFFVGRNRAPDRGIPVLMPLIRV